MEPYRYTVLPVPDPGLGGFTATVPEIPEIVTEGDDEGHALAMAREAIGLYLGDASDKGLPLPVERAAPRLATVDVEIGAPAAVGGGAP